MQHDGPSVAGALDRDAHGLDRGEGGRDVGAVGEPVHDRGALGQRGQEHGAVRDRLLPRRPDRAAARHAAVDDQDPRRVVRS